MGAVGCAQGDGVEVASVVVNPEQAVTGAQVEPLRTITRVCRESGGGIRPPEGF